ncbi:MAG: hypothetical protein ACYSUA_05140 [Planctomycetota bacterium]
MRRGSCLLLLLWTLLSGCASDSEPQVRFPIKIGLLADSQITSQNGFSDFHYRSKTADALVDVGIRTPALECVLAEEMLKVALTRLTEDSRGDRVGVDVILYLGDGANSGGTDEIDTVLLALGEHRDRTGTPTFIIIGNHDYLGTGNIDTPGIRYALLNREGQPENHVLTKYEVLKKFSEFNHANNQLPTNTRFRYVDNIEALDQNKDLDHHTGLYLCGVLSYAEETKDRVEIFLLDSSDYKDAPDWSEVADLGFYGVIGAVSFRDEPGFVSQMGYLQEFAASSSPEFRMLASHYPKDHLDRITFAKPGDVPLNLTNFLWDVTEGIVHFPTFSETLNENLQLLLTPENRNYWMSAHTHVAAPHPDRFVVGGLLWNKYFTAINVGSTTDYRAHVMIVERFDRRRNDRLDDAVGYRQIPLAECDDALLAALPQAIGAYGRDYVAEPAFQSLIEPMDEWIEEAETEGRGWLAIGGMLGLNKKGMSYEDRYWVEVGATILGINKAYRNEAWSYAQTETSEEHLRLFIDLFVDRTGTDREEVISYLGLLTGAYEIGLLSGNSDFSLKSLRRLCTDPP